MVRLKDGLHTLDVVELCARRAQSQHVCSARVQAFQFSRFWMFVAYADDIVQVETSLRAQVLEIWPRR